jgi:hypothetical protein
VGEDLRVALADSEGLSHIETWEVLKFDKYLACPSHPPTTTTTGDGGRK